MNPISDLSLLLRTMKPSLSPGAFAFASIKPAQTIDPTIIVASIRETEGLSVVVTEEDAIKNNLEILFLCAWITLNVNSDLHAVGLTAAFSAALGQSGISCNVVAGAYHDHIFVPIKLAGQAMDVLYQLQACSNSSL
jgi:hypothetical protein